MTERGLRNFNRATIYFPIKSKTNGRPISPTRAVVLSSVEGGGRGSKQTGTVVLSSDEGGGRGSK